MRLTQTAGLELSERSSDEESDVGPFVLNLCPIPAPMSLPQPRSPGLVRYAFFCSRGCEGNREQWWLHMGYFTSRAEACKWLGVLRRVYPLAFLTPAAITFQSE
jgi:hypothetical protein